MEVCDGSVVMLLRSWRTDGAPQPACRWLLREYAERDAACARYLRPQTSGASSSGGGSGSGALSASEKKKAARRRAQQKAAEQMAKQRERFAAMMLDEEAAAAAPAAAASAEGGAPSSSAEAEAEAVTCIICHEGATESAFGFVGFAQPSCVLRRRPEESTGARLHLGLCGHAVHVDCLEKHVASLRQRANANAQFDGRAAVDIQKGEFLCPLCKRLSNTLVPQMCVSADERELAEAVLARAPLPTPPTTLLAQRVLAFRRLLRPHLRQRRPARRVAGLPPRAPAPPPPPPRLAAAASSPNVGGDGAPFGMEAALAEAMAASEAIQAEAAGRGGGEPAPFTPEHQAAVEAAMAEALAAIDAVANAGDVRDNAAQRREAWAAIARMGLRWPTPRG